MNETRSMNKPFIRKLENTTVSILFSFLFFVCIWEFCVEPVGIKVPPMPVLQSTKICYECGTNIKFVTKVE